MMDIPHPMYVTMESAWELELACTKYDKIHTEYIAVYYCCTLPTKSSQNCKYLYNKSCMVTY